MVYLKKKIVLLAIMANVGMCGGLTPQQHFLNQRDTTQILKTHHHFKIAKTDYNIPTLVNSQIINIHPNLISKTRSTTPWFYLQGPYNDVWGSDILQFPQLLANCGPEYYFINNPALSITSTYENNPLNSYQGSVIKVFGLGVKRFKIKSDYNFYGPELFK